MIIRLATISIFILITVYTCTAQIKYEKEYRLNQDDVPKIAIEFVDKLGFKKKIKWYKEEGLNNTSIEAKTKHLSKKYSVEFNPKGEIEDIEVKIKFKEIPAKVQQNISKYLNNNYQKNKICKTQIQLSGGPNSLIDAVLRQNFKNNAEVVTRYELVVKAKGYDKYQKFEFLFDDNGEMLSKAEILLKNTDNLEY